MADSGIVIACRGVPFSTHTRAKISGRRRPPGFATIALTGSDRVAGSNEPETLCIRAVNVSAAIGTVNLSGDPARAAEATASGSATDNQRLLGSVTVTSGDPG